jgi:hypothetical protein
LNGVAGGCAAGFLAGIRSLSSFRLRLCICSYSALTNRSITTNGRCRVRSPWCRRRYFRLRRKEHRWCGSTDSGREEEEFLQASTTGRGTTLINTPYRIDVLLHLQARVVQSNLLLLVCSNPLIIPITKVLPCWGRPASPLQYK